MASGIKLLVSLRFDEDAYSLQDFLSGLLHVIFLCQVPPG